jgi:hypothetical protein
MSSRVRDVTYNTMMLYFSILLRCIDLCVHRRHKRSKVRRITPLLQQLISLLFVKISRHFCSRAWITGSENFRISELIITLVPKKVL